MLSLATIRVEPGSTPGIGITISEQSFFGFRAMFFCFSQGELVGRMQQRRCIFFFFRYCYLPYYRYLVLGTTYYIKSDNVDEEHGYTYLIFPPSWPPLPTSYSRND